MFKIAYMSADLLDRFRVRNFALIMVHNVPMQFISGDFDGQGSTVIPTSARYVLLAFEVWHGALFCWKIYLLPYHSVS